ncbi:MAG: endolytic transglycosylase MltG [Candidatus Limnocylindrales bacterium]
MSIRGGRGPRQQARRMEPGAYEGADMPAWRASDGRGGPPPGRRPDRSGGGKSGLPGLLRFAIFAGLLGVFVIVSALTVLRPLVQIAVVNWAWENPGSLRVSFVADFVRADLGSALTDPVGSDATETVFEVLPGDTPALLAPRLVEVGFVVSERAFVFTAVQEDLAPRLQTGLFLLRGNMTPMEVADALAGPRVVVATVDVTFREGLRIEQLVAKLETVTSGVDPQAFYDLVSAPTPVLLADFPWLKLPEGASLEGYLYPATYTLTTSANGGPFKITTADDLVRMMLAKFHDAVGEIRMNVAEERGLTFDQILALASIVEREAVLDEERPLIAGVYQNRLDGKGGSKTILNADPTVLYGADTVALRKLPIEEWVTYFFWSVPEGGLGNITLPNDLAGYQTYQNRGLIPGPICTPTVESIDAALEPDTKDGYLYFLAIPGDSGQHVFAKTLAEHNANKKQYGYQ